MGIQPTRNLTYWDVPPLFSTDLDAFKKITNFGKSAIKVVGVFAEHLAAWLSPLGKAFSTTSSYISATRFFSQFALWVPNEKGEVAAWKSDGNWCFKLLNTISNHVFTIFETADFFGTTLQLFDLVQISEQMGKIPVIGCIFTSEFSPIKNFFGIFGALCSFGDMACQMVKTLNGMGSHGVYIDLASGFTGRGWFKAIAETPASLIAKEDARKSFREMAMNFVTTALKVSQTILRMLGFAAAGPLLVMLGFADSAANLTKSFLKGSEKTPIANDPRYAHAWSLANTLPVR